MARNGSGVMSVPYPDFTSGTTIVSQQVDDNFATIVAELTNSLAADGQTTPTANIPLGGFKITNLGAPTATTDAVRLAAIEGGHTSTTGATGLTLVNTSSRSQTLVSTAASQAIVLPDATTLTLGHAFLIRNGGTTSSHHMFTLKASGGGALVDIYKGVSIVARLEAQASAAGTWALQMFGEVDASGAEKARSAFLAWNSAGQSNITTGGDVVVAFNQEIYDQNSDYNTSTYTFTAPVTGIYHFDLAVLLVDVDTAMTQLVVGLDASNRDVEINLYPADFTADSPTTVTFGCDVDMDAADTIKAFVNVTGGANQVDISSTGALVLNSYFSGHLVT